MISSKMINSRVTIMVFSMMMMGRALANNNHDGQVSIKDFPGLDEDFHKNNNQGNFGGFNNGNFFPTHNDIINNDFPDGQNFKDFPGFDDDFFPKNNQGNVGFDDNPSIDFPNRYDGNIIDKDFFQDSDQSFSPFQTFMTFLAIVPICMVIGYWGWRCYRAKRKQSEEATYNPDGLPAFPGGDHAVGTTFGERQTTQTGNGVVQAGEATIAYPAVAAFPAAANEVDQLEQGYSSVMISNMEPLPPPPVVPVVQAVPVVPSAPKNQQ